MKCPSCGQECADGSEDCPACGVIFAKWRARQERQAAPGPATAEPDPSIRPASGGLPIPKLVMAAVVAGGGFFAYKKFFAPKAGGEAPASEEGAQPSGGESGDAPSPAKKKSGIPERVRAVLSEMAEEGRYLDVDVGWEYVRWDVERSDKYTHPARLPQSIDELGLTPPQKEEFAPDEKDRLPRTKDGQVPKSKCVVDGEIVYFVHPPARSEKVTECWRRDYGTRVIAHTGTEMLMANNSPLDRWVVQHWQSGLGRWDAFSQDDAVRGFRAVLDKELSEEKIDEALSAYQLERDGLPKATGEARNAILKAYRMRVVREAVLSRIEAMEEGE